MEPLMFDLVVDPSGDFVGGVNDELLVKLMLGYPTKWIDLPVGRLNMVREVYSAKYAFVFEQLGTLSRSLSR